MKHEMRVTCSACPVQIEGVIDYRRWYFRARHDHWSFQVGEVADMNQFAGVEGTTFMSGEFAGAGDMPIELAESICEFALDLWKAQY